MASELTSTCTEVNNPVDVDDEKEEGEISLDDVSSSEEGQPYNLPKGLANCCPHCKSVKTCATWCGNLITYKNNVRRGIGLQGKENRANHVRESEPSTVGFTTKFSQDNNKPKKNVNNAISVPHKGASDELVPISSGSDLDIAEPEHDEPKKKSTSNKKRRKKRRKKSESPSPSRIDLALLVKESLHKLELKKESKRSRPTGRHNSPDKSKLSPKRRKHSPSSKQRRRARSPGLHTRLARKSLSPKPRSKLSRKSPALTTSDISAEPPPESPSTRGSVNRLLKKVRRLETFSCKSSDKGSSLKDKLSGIIQPAKSHSCKVTEHHHSSNLPTETLSSETLSSEVKDTGEKSVKKVAKEPAHVIKIEIVEEPESNSKGNSIERIDEKKHDDAENDKEEVEAKEVGTVKLVEKVASKADLPSPRPVSPLRPPDVSPPPSPSAKLPNFCIDDNDEDLKLRMIALHSAVLKKHLTRMKKGGLKKNKQLEMTVPRMESPFSSTFLKDFPQLAEVCNPSSLIDNREDIYCPEDMELDSDLELDKELLEMDAAELNRAPSPIDDVNMDQTLFGDNAGSNNAFVKTSTPRNLSLYSPSNPTVTPVTLAAFQNCYPIHGSSLDKEAWKLPSINCAKNLNNLNGSIFELANQESRPYSPTDSTIYDPDLPGVHSNDKSKQQNDTTPPLQPPPLPPLSMLDADESLILECPTNILDPRVEPMVPPPLPPPSLLNNFAGVPQPLNPVPMPGTLFNFVPSVIPMAPAPTLVSASSSASSLAEILSGSSNQQAIGASPPLHKLDGSVEYPSGPTNFELASSTVSDDFGETDLDGSPLVIIDKRPSPPHPSWPLYNSYGTHCLRDTSNVIRVDADTMFPVPEHNLDVLQSNIAFNDCNRKQAASKTKPSSIFKPMRVQALMKKCVTTSSAAAFNMNADDEDEEEVENIRESRTQSVNIREHSRTDNKEVSNHLTESSRSRKRRKKSAKTPKEIIEITTVPSRLLLEKKKEFETSQINCDKVKSSEDKEISKGVQSSEEARDDEKSNQDKERRGSIEDDPDALREQLLASLKRKKSESSVSTSKPHLSSSEDTTKPTPTVITTTTNNLSVLKRPLPIDTANQSVHKFAKKMNIIPASTKVVNNAKRYQNSMSQRRLVLQKLMAANKSRFKLYNTQGSSPKTTQPTNTTSKHTLIIRPNDEESDDESGSEELKQIEMSVEQFLKNIRQQQEKSCSTADIANDTDVEVHSNPPTNASTPNVIHTDAISTSTTASTIVSTATTTSATTIVSTTITTPSTEGSHLEKDKLNFTAPNTSRLKKLNLLTTPQAVKHLPASQQEEYRRLKQQIIEREILKLRKAKEITAATISSSVPSTAVTSSLPVTKTTSTSADATAKIVPPVLNTPTAPTSSTVTIVSSIPEETITSNSCSSLQTISKPVVFDSKVVASKPTSSSSLAKESLVTLNKMSLETHKLVTVDDTSKQNVKNPMSPANKESTVSISDSAVNSKNSDNKKDKSYTSEISKITAANSNVNKLNSMNLKASLSSRKMTSQPANSSRVQNLSKQQLTLLDKMNSVLNSQKKQISAVAQKVSTLRILTKDQINQKTSQIQQNNSENSVRMDDLNKTDNSNLISTQEKNEREAQLLKSKTDVNKTVCNKELQERKNQDCNVSSENSITSSNEQSSSKSTPSSIDKSNKGWSEFKETVSEEVQSLLDLSIEEQKKLLLDSEEKLITKRHAVLDDIADMSGSLRQWEIERDLQNTLSMEIEKLYEQLRIAEEKFQQQKEKLNAIQPKVSMYHEKINDGRKECFRLSKICDNLGQMIAGPGYKVPTAGAELLNSKIKEVANHTQRLKNKTLYINRNSNKSVANTNQLNLKLKNFNKKQNNANNLKSDSTARCVNINSNEITDNEEISKDNESVLITNTSILNTENDNRLKTKNQTINSSLINNSNETTKSNNSTLETELNTSINLAINIKSEKESVLSNDNNSMSKSIGNLKMNEQPIICSTSKVVIKTEDTDSEIFMDASPIRSNKNTNNSDNSTPITNSTLTSIPTEVNLVCMESDNPSTNKKVIDITTPLKNTEQETLSGNEQSDISQNDFCENLSNNLNTVLKNNLNSSEKLINNKSVPAKTSVKNPLAKVTEPKKMQVVPQLKNSFENVNLNSIDNRVNSKKSNISNIEERTLSPEKVKNIPKTSVSQISSSHKPSVSGFNEKIKESAIKDNLKNRNVKASSLNAGHSTLLEEISLLEIANSIEIPDKIDMCKKSKKQKCYKQFSKQIMGYDIKSKNSKNFQPYESCLKHLYEPRNKIDGIICPFQLSGTCNDEDCQFTHLSTSHSSG